MTTTDLLRMAAERVMRDLVIGRATRDRVEWAREVLKQLEEKKCSQPTTRPAPTSADLPNRSA